uniref:Uncharacterized protein n=1 Tax=Mus musculus TaxID=10090 RepID=Q9D9I3_MOUSE|nr:unnamed protein product [Mus musculus]
MFAPGTTFLCVIRTTFFTETRWATKPRKKQLKPQTYNLASRASSPPQPHQASELQVHPQPHPDSGHQVFEPHPTSMNLASCRAYGRSQGACFSKGNVSSYSQRHQCVIGNCLQDTDAPNKNKIRNKNPLQRQ